MPIANPKVPRVLAAAIDIVGVVSERLQMQVLSITAVHVEGDSDFELPELGARRAPETRERDDHGTGRFEALLGPHGDNLCSRLYFFKFTPMPWRFPIEDPRCAFQRTKAKDR
jgi:hypothetical protein